MPVCRRLWYAVGDLDLNNTFAGRAFGCHGIVRAIGILTLTIVVSTCDAQLRIVNYNTANSGDNGSPVTPRTGMDVVLQAIGNEARAGIGRPIDILALQEQQSSATTTAAFVTILNNLYGPGTYARATLDGNTLGAGRPGLIYNTNTVQLVGAVGVGTVSGSGASRQPIRYQLRPVGYTSSADFYIYNSHYNSSNPSQRAVEAQTIRNNADALGQGASAIFLGDFNIDSSSETMYQTLLSSGNGQAFDPINTPGTWNNNSALRITHTQSPYNPAFNDPSLVAGGMDDRFDFQLVTDELRDNEGLSYIPGTYRAFGNNGSHALNDYINDPSNTAQPTNVLNALARVSDHLPLVADYQVPAVMQLQVSVAPRVIRDAAVDVPVQVWNAANVNVAQGADELDFSLAGVTGVTGSASGSDAALGAIPSYNFLLDTSTPGTNLATVTATTTSPQVPQPTISQTSAFQVLNTAQPSFDDTSQQLDLAVDFGILIPDGQFQQAGWQLFNLLVPGATSKLDLDSIMAAGDTDVFSNSLAPFSGLFAGTSQGFTIGMQTTQSGVFSATWNLHASDEDIPGELMHELSIAATGRVALPGDANLDGVVDGNDFVIWNQFKFQSGTTWSSGDFNFDGSTDGSDFILWNQNKFQSLNASSPQVPEPNVASWLWWVLATPFVTRRRVRIKSI